MATNVPRARWSGEVLPGGAAAAGGVHLAYEGKIPRNRVLETPPAQPVLAWGESDRGRLFAGDNLPVLSYLATDPLVRGHVRMAYLDPPFATNGVFQSRTQRDAYADVLTGAASVEAFRQRLLFVHELLADDGSIYVHLDQNLAFYAKVILDEIFGAGNFRAWITRRKCNPKNYTRKTYGNISDYILFYTKTDSYVWSRPYEPWTDERAATEYACVDKATGRRYKKVPVHAPGIRNGETGLPWRGKLPPPGKHWQYRPSELDAMDARGEIYWSKTGNPRRKIYLDQSEGIPLQDMWWDVRDAHNQMARITGYPTEKNPALLERLIAASSNEGDLVLDCYSGSGTTLAVSDRLGRRWIGVDSSPEAIRTTLRRFSHGRERMGDFVERPASQTLDLFGGSLSGPKPEPLRDAVEDFELFAAGLSTSELDAILDEWQQVHG